MSEPQRPDLGDNKQGGGQSSADLDLEMALLAVLASRDMGEATEPVRLDTLSPTEKEVLLQLIRGKLGLADHSGPMALSDLGDGFAAESAPDSETE